MALPTVVLCHGNEVLKLCVPAPKVFLLMATVTIEAIAAGFTVDVGNTV